MLLECPDNPRCRTCQSFIIGHQALEHHAAALPRQQLLLLCPALRVYVSLRRVGGGRALQAWEVASSPAWAACRPAHSRAKSPASQAQQSMERAQSLAAQSSLQREPRKRPHPTGSANGIVKSVVDLGGSRAVQHHLLALHAAASKSTGIGRPSSGATEPQNGAEDAVAARMQVHAQWAAHPPDVRCASTQGSPKPALAHVVHQAAVEPPPACG